VDAITYTPIGVVRSPWREVAGMPLQSVAAADVAGTVEVLPEYAEGLRDLDGFSHLLLLTHLHQVTAARLTVTPFLDTQSHGVFATRSPARPNPIGLSVVCLLKVEGTTLHIAGVDLLDGTPVLDIKPYVPTFDVFAAERTGWFAENAAKVQTIRADDRFR